MVSAIIGIVLIFLGAILWAGQVSLAHAVAILIVAVGVLVLLGGLLPVQYIRRQ